MKLQGLIACLTMQALIRCHINDKAWLAGSRWTESYLKAAAVSHSCFQELSGEHVVLIIHTCLWTAQGHCCVSVEHRQQAWEGYGQGRKVHMPFREFLEKMAAGDVLHYLSTQEVQEQALSPAVLPAVCGPLLSSFQRDMLPPRQQCKVQPLDAAHASRRPSSPEMPPCMTGSGVRGERLPETLAD